MRRIKFQRIKKFQDLLPLRLLKRVYLKEKEKEKEKEKNI